MIIPAGEKNLSTNGFQSNAKKVDDGSATCFELILFRATPRRPTRNVLPTFRRISLAHHRMAVWGSNRFWGKSNNFSEPRRGAWQQNELNADFQKPAPQVVPCPHRFVPGLLHFQEGTPPACFWWFEKSIRLEKDISATGLKCGVSQRFSVTGSCSRPARWSSVR